MLDQLIYTECNPQRDLLHGGKVVHKSGYGVFSMSRELFSEGKDIRLKSIYDILTFTNCSKEKDPSVGTFGSYIYTNTISGIKVFLYDYGRPHCKNPLKERLHRSGIHIKQCLIGDVECYPCSFFGSEVWNAHKEHEDNYYFEDVMGYEPPFLPQVTSKPSANEEEIRSEISSFVSDGRRELLKMAVGFINEQLRLPPEQQKVLLIRDEPQTVEKWVTAISMCFPGSIAGSITFNTNISGLSNKTESRLFYPADPNAARSAAADPESQKKYPFFMIAGFHPHDDSSASVRQFANSRFIILDGAKKTFDYAPQDEESAYYKAVEEQSGQLRDFCAHILPKLTGKVTDTDIPGLFDSYYYLLYNSGKWGYEQTLRHMRCLTGGGLPERELSGRILDNCLKNYNSFADADRMNNYPVLEIMTKLAGLCLREDEVTACIADGIQETINNSSHSGAVFAANWRSISNSVLGRLVQPILCDLFNDTELEEYYSRFPYSDPLTVETMLEMFFNMLANEGNVPDILFAEKVRVLFVYYGMLTLSEHEENLKRIIQKIARYDRVMDFLIYNIGGVLLKNDAKKAYSWFGITAEESGKTITDICEGICGMGAVNIELVEGYLKSCVIRAGHLTQDIVTALNYSIKQLGSNDKTGISVFEEGAKLSSLQEYSDIIRFVQNCALSAEAAGYIYSYMDRKLMYYCFDKNVSDKTFEAMKSWGVRIKRNSNSMMLREFCTTFERLSDPEKVIGLINRTGRGGLYLPDGFVQNRSFERIADKAGDFCNGSIHLGILTMFETSEQERMVTTYVCHVLERSMTAGNIDRQLTALCSAGIMQNNASGCDKERAASVRKMILEVTQYQLSYYYRPSLEAKILKTKECDRQVRDVLIKMLKSAKQDQKKKAGLGGLINNMFNHKK